MAQNLLLFGTRKGLVTYHQKNNGNWEYRDTQFLGAPVSIASYDQNTGTYWAFLDHGHWGCKLHRSKDGKNWEELEAPKYPEGEEIKEGVPASTKLLWHFQMGVLTVLELSTLVLNLVVYSKAPTMGIHLIW